MRSNQLSYPAIAESECKGNRNFQSCKIFRQKNAVKFIIPGCGIDFERATEKPQSMSLTQSARAGIRDALGVVKLIAGLVLLVALSWEIIAGDHVHMSRTYLAIQFVVCLVFLCDFFVRWAAAERPGRFFWRNLPFLLLSVPYLNILAWSGVGMTHDWGVLVGLIPLLRAFLAMVIIVRWLVSENRMRRLFFAYIFTVVVFTYISGLVFYDYEVLVNPKLHGFGNALWWAWMNVTTVGAEIFPVTAVGKVFCVLLPSLGMMFFPIFTTYVLQEYTHKKGE